MPDWELLRSRAIINGHQLSMALVMGNRSDWTVRPVQKPEFIPLAPSIQGSTPALEGIADSILRQIYETNAALGHISQTEIYLYGSLNLESMLIEALRGQQHIKLHSNFPNTALLDTDVEASQENLLEEALTDATRRQSLMLQSSKKKNSAVFIDVILKILDFSVDLLVVTILFIFEVLLPIFFGSIWFLLGIHAGSIVPGFLDTYFYVSDEYVVHLMSATYLVAVIFSSLLLIFLSRKARFTRSLVALIAGVALASAPEALIDFVSFALPKFWENPLERWVELISTLTNRY